MAMHGRKRIVPFRLINFYLLNRKCFMIKKDQSFIKIGQEGPETEDRSDKLHEKFITEPTIWKWLIFRL